ncbi:hypothetical protein [Aurantiacibacter aquimixticola]|nr:hypothetical protein [Aurantiacibacter aquimixticola]
MRKGFSGALLLVALSHLNGPTPDHIEWYLDAFFNVSAGLASLYGAIGIVTDRRYDRNDDGGDEPHHEE